MIIAQLPGLVAYTSCRKGLTVTKSPEELLKGITLQDSIASLTAWCQGCDRPRPPEPFLLEFLQVSVAFPVVFCDPSCTCTCGNSTIMRFFTSDWAWYPDPKALTPSAAAEMRRFINYVHMPVQAAPRVSYSKYGHMYVHIKQFAGMSLASQISRSFAVTIFCLPSLSRCYLIVRDWSI